VYPGGATSLEKEREIFSTSERSRGETSVAVRIQYRTAQYPSRGRTVTSSGEGDRQRTLEKMTEQNRCPPKRTAERNKVKNSGVMKGPLLGQPGEGEKGQVRGNRDVS